MDGIFKELRPWPHTFVAYFRIGVFYRIYRFYLVPNVVIAVDYIYTNMLLNFVAYRFTYLCTVPSKSVVLWLFRFYTFSASLFPTRYRTVYNIVLTVLCTVSSDVVRSTALRSTLVLRLYFPCDFSRRLFVSIGLMFAPQRFCCTYNRGVYVLRGSQLVPSQGFMLLRRLACHRAGYVFAITVSLPQTLQHTYIYLPTYIHINRCWD